MLVIILVFGTVFFCSWCELGRRVSASFVCNLIFIYMDILIVRLRSSGFGCYLLSVWCIFWERTVPGKKVPGNERSRERMFQGTNGPENESSIMGTNVPGNE